MVIPFHAHISLIVSLKVRSSQLTHQTERSNCNPCVAGSILNRGVTSLWQLISGHWVWRSFVYHHLFRNHIGLVVGQLRTNMLSHHGRQTSETWPKMCWNQHKTYNTQNLTYLVSKSTDNLLYVLSRSLTTRKNCNLKTTF